MVSKAVSRGLVKSGVLPKPREILPKEKPSWIKAQEARLVRGFEREDMVPKGSVSNPPQRKRLTADERIKFSAKEPRERKNPVNEIQKWKQTQKDIRRKYFKESLKTQEAIDKRELEEAERQHEKARLARLALANEEESLAKRLTLPTIDSELLAGNFVQPRTKEEEADLLIKREANRKQTLFKVKEQQSKDLIELYQSCKDYIITEEQLDDVVNKLFSEDQKWSDQELLETLGAVSGISSNASNRQSPSKEDRLKRVETRIFNELLGVTSNSSPGLPEIEEALGHKPQPVPEDIEKQVNSLNEN